MNAISGVKTGTVVQVIDPTAQGRVSVRFNAAATPLQEWAHVIAALRNAASAQERLQVEDKVLLAFEDGNPLAPFVIGKL